MWTNGIKYIYADHIIFVIHMDPRKGVYRYYSSPTYSGKLKQSKIFYCEQKMVHEIFQNFLQLLFIYKKNITKADGNNQ